jgi:hypothetical protein
MAANESRLPNELLSFHFHKAGIREIFPDRTSNMNCLPVRLGNGSATEFSGFLRIQVFTDPRGRRCLLAAHSVIHRLGGELVGALLTSVQFFEGPFQLFKFLSGIAEFAFRCKALVVGKVFGGLGDQSLQIRGGPRCTGC